MAGPRMPRPLLPRPWSISTLLLGRAIGHATQRCIPNHLEDMFNASKFSHLRLNARGLFSKRTNSTLRPIYTRRLLRTHRPHHTPLINSPRGFATKSPGIDKVFEEGSLPDYEPEQFYPVNIGDTINSRYHVVGKLGFGANSTVWFCRDLLYGTGTLLALWYDQLTRYLGTISMLY